jgi:hypothetical protein
MWVNTAHHLADVNMSMSSLLKLKSDSVEHVEVGINRSRRDSSDMTKMLDWLDKNNPFDVSLPKLRSLSTGITVNECDGINCDDADTAGVDIQMSIDNLAFTEVKFSKCNQVRTLAVLSEKNVSGKQDTPKDTNSFFHRLLILAERSDIASYFSCELTTVPTALFKDSFMRKPKKPDLAKRLTDGVPVEYTASISRGAKVVVDVGSLLHKVRWLKNANFTTIFQQYSKHVLTQYGNAAVVVFDGYSATPSTKDHEHRRRASGVRFFSSEININPSESVLQTNKPSWPAIKINSCPFSY